MWLDRQLTDSSIFLIFFLAFCMPLPAIILGLLGLIFCRDPMARERAGYLIFLPLAFVGGGLLMFFLADTLGGAAP